MTVKLTSFYSRVAPHVLGAPDPAIEEAIRDSCIEFCERSLIVQDTLDPVDTVAGQIDYDLEPPQDTVVTKIMRAWYKEERLLPFSTDALQEPTLYAPAYSGYDPSTGSPRFLFQKDESTFSVLPIPEASESGVLTMRVALKPTRTAMYVDDALLTTWVEVITCGAKARLMSMPNQSYSNPAGALAHKALFEQGLGRARRVAEHGMVRAMQAVQMRPFA